MTTALARRIIAGQQVRIAKPLPPTPPGLHYDSDTSIDVQDEPWTCSVYAADWCLRSLGVESDNETLELEMLARGTVTPEFGLMDARGYGLANVLRDHLPSGTDVQINEAVTWDWLVDVAGAGPIALGGRAWNHWCAVRRDGLGLLLANSAPGWMGIWQTLTHADFDRLGSFSAVRVPVEVGGAWQFWSAAEIAAATGCPASSISKNWPLIYNELAVRGIGDYAVCAAAIATVAIETASTFEPVREAFWLDEGWRRANLRYYPYYGRGFIQLTWNGRDPSAPNSDPILNYTRYGNAIGVDLANDPDAALVPANAAAVLAEYFKARGVADSARVHAWAEVRRKVQGGTAGLDRLTAIVGALGAL